MKVNTNQELKEVSRKDALDMGVNLDSVAVCKKMRQLGKLGRLSVRMDAYSSGLARNLIDYLEYCGVNVEDYIKDYLSNLQPYMISRVQDQEPSRTYRCVIDNMYAVSLYIKADTKQFDEVVVSFHESYGKGGVAKKNLPSRTAGSGFVPVFAESIGSINLASNDFSVNLLIQRGLMTLPVSVMAIKCEDFFLVRERDISPQILSYCNQYIEDLYSSNLNLNFDQIEVFTMLQQLSFTSYGRDIFSSISLLTDSLIVQNDAISKKVADFALIHFVQNLKLTADQGEELKSLLATKYAVTNIQKMPAILERINAAVNEAVLLSTVKKEPELELEAQEIANVKEQE